MHLTDNQTKVRDALPTQATATPAAVAEATGLAYSTVTRLLRELASLGAAAKDPDGWRHASPADATDEPPATPTNTPAADATEAEHPGPVDSEQPDRAGTKEQQEPDQIERDGVAQEDPPVEAEPDVPDQIAGDAADGGVDAASADVASEARQPRMAKGELQERVLVALRAATQPMGPTQLSKLLDGKSQGAISNACDRLVERGDAILVNEAPRRFEATRTN